MLFRSGRKPQDVHNAHATAVFGKDFAKNKEYIAMDKAAKESARQTAAHLKKHHGITPKRVAWTSQASDHETETGVKDPISKADLIVTGSHKGDHRKGKKVALSLKHGKLKSVNYSNPGLKTLGRHAGVDLTQYQKPHKELLNRMGNPTHEEYKNHPKRHEIEASTRLMTQNMTRAFADGVRKKYKNDDQLKDYIKRSVGANGHTEGGSEEQGKTHLPHVLVHAKLKSDGSYEHHVMPAEDHVHNYLTHFKDLHVVHNPGQTSVTIYGTHKGTGKIMPVHRTSIYMGGAHETANARGATTLPSEFHKTVDRKSTRLNSSHIPLSRMPSSA